MSRKKNKLLETLRAEFEAADREREEKRQAYQREKYRGDAELIRDAMMENVAVMEGFDSMKTADKKKVAQMFASSFPVLLNSEKVKVALDEAEAKRKKISEQRAERNNRKPEQDQQTLDSKSAQINLRPTAINSFQQDFGNRQ